MTKIKVTRDGVKGADDGATVRPYPKDGGPNKDGVYDVSTALAEVLIEAGEATEIVEPKRSISDRLKERKRPNQAAAEKEAADKAAAEKEAADKAAAEKEAADKAAAEKEAADKAAAGSSAPKLPGLPTGVSKK